jgi:SAM-dependent methyltransferase
MHQGTLEDIEGAGIVAAIAAHHVLEHVSAPARFLRAAHRLLEDGGLLLLSLPNLRAWSAFLRGWGGYQPYHLYYFTPRSLQDLLHDSGFDVLRAWTRDPHGSTLDSIYRSMFHRVLPFSAAPEFRPGKPTNGARWTPAQMSRVVLAFGMLPLSWLARALGRGDEVVVVARVRRIDRERAESGFEP